MRRRTWRQWLPHQALYTFPTTEVGVFGVWTSRLAPKAIYKAPWFAIPVYTGCSLELLGFLQ